MKTVYCGAEKKSEFKTEGGNAPAALTIPMMAVSSDRSKQADGKDKDEKLEKSKDYLISGKGNEAVHHIETQCPACDPLFQKLSANLKLAQQT